MTTAALIASILLGPSPVIVPPPQGNSPSGVTAYGSGTCIGADSAVYDNNGAQGCQKLTDVAPQGIMVRPQPAFAGGTQTAADTVICGGQDETTIAIDDYTLCGTDIVTVTVYDSNGSSTATVLTEAADWTAATSNAATCTSLATAVAALSGVGATCSTATVRVTLDTGTGSVTLTEGDETCTTVSTGTRGDVEIYASQVLGPAGTVSLPSYSFVDDPNTGFYNSAADNIQLVTGGSARILIGTTVTMNGVQTLSNSSSVAAYAATAAGGGFSVGSTGQYQFAAGASGNAVGDVGLARYGIGQLKTTNGTTGNANAIIMPINVAAAPAEPAVCGSGTFGMMAVVNDTNDTVHSHVCYCGQIGDDSTYDWLIVGTTTACPFF